MTNTPIPGQSAQRLRSHGGYTLLEVLVSVAILGVLMRAALPHIDTRQTDINTATNQVIADFRWARTRAITSGVHYAVKWTSTTAYQVQKLKLSGTTWVLDSVARTITLPNSVAVSGTLPALQEFNTRGLIISSTTVVYQTLKDTKSGGTHKVGVWPSGQVYAES